MAKLPPIPLDTDAYLADTGHLTTEQHGAYYLLLMISWRTKETRVPDDDRMLARYTRMTLRRWKLIRPTLEPLFNVEGGYWYQKRLLVEKEDARRRSRSAIRGGRASARSRWGDRAAPEPPAAPERPKEAKVDDPKAEMFRLGRKVLGDADIKNPGRVLGRWLKDHTAEEITYALTEAQSQSAADPVSYVKAVLNRLKTGEEGEVAMPC